MEEFLEFVPLTPSNFFQIQADFFHLETPFGNKPLTKYLLPDLSSLNAEYSFASVHAGWNKSGLHFFVSYHEPFISSNFPDVIRDVTRGDSVELFIDTRDVKTSGFNTRFCHHFFFLPVAVDGIMAGEITKFRRVEDAHELALEGDLKVHSSFNKDSFSMQIFIPSNSLHGYDPDQFDRLGFTYRLNRVRGNPQHFSATSSDYQIEQQPSLWSSIKLR